MRGGNVYLRKELMNTNDNHITRQAWWSMRKINIYDVNDSGKC